MLTIEGRHVKATAEDCDDGVEVVFWTRARNTDGTVWKFNSRGVIDKPFHVVCDDVHSIVTRTKAPPPIKTIVPGWNAAMTRVHC